MPIYRLDGHCPVIHGSVYVAESADVIGRVVIAQQASIWSHVAIRGDNDLIEIGEGTNIQEGSVLHVDEGKPMRVGRSVTVGHQAMLHGCTVNDGALIGMQAIVLNGAVIGRNVLVGAGAIIPEGKDIPDGVLVIGVGKIVRDLTADEIAGMRRNTENYVARARLFASRLERVDRPIG